MLKFTRRQRTTVGIGGAILIGMIIVVFIFWGTGGIKSGPGNVIARVNGSSITVSEYRERFLQRIRTFESQINQSITPEMLQQLRIPEQILSQLIDEELINQEASRLGLKVTTKELQTVITDSPSFKDEQGRFSPIRYKRLLQYSGLAPAQYENQLRSNLLRSKLIGLMADSILVSKSEAKKVFLIKNDKVNVEVVKVDPADLVSKISFLPQAIEEYVKTHEAVIQNYYASHEEEFNTPEQVKARHILIGVKEGATPDQDKEARNKIDEIRKKATRANFSELAQKNSQDQGSGKKGGDLGWFSRDRMVKAFSDVAFSLQPGQISDVFKSQYGYHIILLEEKRPAVERPLEGVKFSIAEKLIVQERAEEKAKELAIQILETWKQGKPLTNLLSPYNLKLASTGLFARDTTFVPILGRSQEAVSTVFGLSKEHSFPTAPLFINGSWFSIKFKERVGAEEQTFAKEEEGIEKELNQQKSYEAFQLFFGD